MLNRCGKTAIGSMFIYDNGVAQTINAVDQYHAVTGFATGTLLDGITYLVGALGTITSTADNGGILRCTDAAHGLSTGQYLTLTGMGDTAHVENTRVTVIDVDTFDCDDIAYNSAADTGFWNRGSSLIVGDSYGGNYSIVWSASMLSAGNNKNYKLEMVKNITHLDEFVSERRISVAGDLGSIGAGGIVALEGGDVVYMQAEGTTDATDCTFKHANVTIHKL